MSVPSFTPMPKKKDGQECLSYKAASHSKAKPLLFLDFETRLDNSGDVRTVFHG